MEEDATRESDLDCMPIVGEVGCFLSTHIYNVIMPSTEIRNLQWYRSTHHSTLHCAHCTQMKTVQCTKLYSEHGAQYTPQGTVQGETIERYEMFDEWYED